MLGTNLSPRWRSDRRPDTQGRNEDAAVLRAAQDIKQAAGVTEKGSSKRSFGPDNSNPILRCRRDNDGALSRCNTTNARCNPPGLDRATSMSTGETSVPAGQPQTTAPALQIKCPIRHQGASVAFTTCGPHRALQLVLSQPPGDEREERWFLSSCAQQELLDRSYWAAVMPCCRAAAERFQAGRPEAFQ